MRQGSIMYRSYYERLGEEAGNGRTLPYPGLQCAIILISEGMNRDCRGGPPPALKLGKKCMHGQHSNGQFEAPS